MWLCWGCINSKTVAKGMHVTVVDAVVWKLFNEHKNLLNIKEDIDY